MFYRFICLILLAQRLVALEDLEFRDSCGEENIVLKEDVVHFNFLWFPDMIQNFTCTYNVTGWEGTQLRLSIFGMYLNDTEGCSRNYIKVADNVSALETTKLVTCGAGSIDVTTNSHTMAIKINVMDFNNSFILGNIGWSIGEFIQNPEACGPTEKPITSRTQPLSIPLEGKRFDHPVVCSYVITSSDQQPLELLLSSFSLDGGKKCEESYLDVWVASEQYRLCDDMPPKRPFVSEAGQMRLVLKNVKNPGNTKITGTIYDGPIDLQNATTPVLPVSLNGASRIVVDIILLLCIPLHWW